MNSYSCCLSNFLLAFFSCFSSFDTFLKNDLLQETCDILQAKQTLFMDKNTSVRGKNRRKLCIFWLKILQVLYFFAREIILSLRYLLSFPAFLVEQNENRISQVTTSAFSYWKFSKTDEWMVKKQKGWCACSTVVKITIYFSSIFRRFVQSVEFVFKTVRWLFRHFVFLLLSCQLVVRIYVAVYWLNKLKGTS